MVTGRRTGGSFGPFVIDRDNESGECTNSGQGVLDIKIIYTMEKERRLRHLFPFPRRAGKQRLARAVPLALELQPLVRHVSCCVRRYAAHLRICRPERRQGGRGGQGLAGLGLAVDPLTSPVLACYHPVQH